MKTYLEQINIYYNPEVNKHKKTIAHAESMGEVLAIPFIKMPNSNTVWTTIYEGLGEEALQIMDEDFIAKNNFSPATFQDWYKIVTHNLEHIHSPIAVQGQKVIFCDRQTKVYELMETAV